MFIFWLVLGYVLTVWEGFALKVLWVWFLVPLGLPAIGLAHAVGLAALASLVTHQAPSNVDSDEREAQSVGWAAVAPAVALAVGWIAHSCM